MFGEKRNAQTHGRALGRLALDGDIAADFAHPRAHVAQPISFSMFWRGGIKTVAVVLYRKNKYLGGRFEPQLHGGGLSVLEDVVERFFENGENVVLGFRGDRDAADALGAL